MWAQAAMEAFQSILDVLPSSIAALRGRGQARLGVFDDEVRQFIRQ